MTAVRRYARRVLVVLTALFVVAVVVQVLTAGFGIFGATSFDLHETLGYTATHGLSVLVLLAALVAWTGRATIGLAFLIAALTTVQVILPEVDNAWVAGLHPVTAVVLLALGGILLYRLRSPAAGTVPPT